MRANRILWQKGLAWALYLAFSLFLSACQSLLPTSMPTLIPVEYLPTAIALTLVAANPSLASPAGVTETPAPTPTLEPSYTPTLEPISTATATSPPPPPAVAPLPSIPEAKIRIRSPGDLSRVASPITINAYLRPGDEGKVIIELLGEDRRVVSRQIKVLPWVDKDGFASLYIKLDFEISATAEAGRLVISSPDEFGRTKWLNSVPLILISLGEPDIIPPVDTLETIVIQQPPPRTLVQGGTLLVHGTIRPSSDQYFMAQLITTDGRVVGKRVGNAPFPAEGSFTSFTVEVPYSVTEPTEARLVVWEGEGGFSNIVHLSSVEVMLSP